MDDFYVLRKEQLVRLNNMTQRRKWTTSEINFKLDDLFETENKFESMKLVSSPTNFR
jgi:hypothetical protein